MALFAVEVTLADDPEGRERLRPQHRAHMGELAAGGQVWLAGPFADGSGTGLMVFDVPDRPTLERLLDSDPYARAGMVLKRRIKPWQPVLGSRLEAAALPG